MLNRMDDQMDECCLAEKSDKIFCYFVKVTQEEETRFWDWDLFCEDC